MRIPHKKIYRAFPELDLFTDHQCDLYVQRIRNTKTGTHTLRFGVVAAAIFLLLFVWIFFASVDATMRATLDRSIGWRIGDYIRYSFWILFISGVIPFICLSVRDILLRLLLKREIGARIERIRCLKCKYSLMGMTTRDGLVTCPECGHSMTLAKIGVSSPEDLLPPKAQGIADHAKCPMCQSALTHSPDACRTCGWERTRTGSAGAGPVLT